jgi:hypothetical protein
LINEKKRNKEQRTRSALLALAHRSSNGTLKFIPCFLGEAVRDLGYDGIKGGIKMERSTYPRSGPLTRRQKGHRLVDRKWILKGLLDELANGDSLIRLYAGLLAVALIESEPSLKRDYGSKLVSLGIDIDEAA